MAKEKGTTASWRDKGKACWEKRRETSDEWLMNFGILISQDYN
jgi:hypothetical protein